MNNSRHFYAEAFKYAGFTFDKKTAFNGGKADFFFGLRGGDDVAELAGF